MTTEHARLIFYNLYNSSPFFRGLVLSRKAWGKKGNTPLKGVDSEEKQQLIEFLEELVEALKTIENETEIEKYENVIQKND